MVKLQMINKLNIYYFYSVYMNVLLKDFDLNKRFIKKLFYF